MRHFTNIIIGFGKAGKTLAGTLVQHGQDVLVIEKDAMMYGGTCINVACLPTKNMIINSHNGEDYADAFAAKNKLTSMLRNKNYHKVADQETATVLNADAEFLDDHTLQVTDDSGTETLTADRIFINTGSTPILPNIAGLNDSQRVFTSKTLLDQSQQTKRLAILGSGPIGLEFASMYAQFGSDVTVIGQTPAILERYEPEIATAAKADLETDGVSFLLNAQLTKVADTATGLSLTVTTETGSQTIDADALLVATGRRANTDDLHLERTHIETGSRGEIAVNDTLETSVANVYALGDVAGSPQFTYVSLDDWRIMANQLFGDKTRTRTNRPIFANTIFLNPAISSVGQTEVQLKAAGTPYQVLKMATAGVPKAQVIGNPRGSYKALIDPETHQILGVTIYAEEAYETINVIAVAMQNHLPAEVLRDQIYTHPTMTEALNDLFNF
ncbi:pyridine nucleotide-disulfide oxidoreductase [Secundilactobacillus paracollinoides]|uniref:Pyridine nucleotide-disulfide oxidoreductase n=1 Tax=Secundilactobacillus paracollinoides TaxID=240427 RepID=A0A1B2IWM3_9LACO|nr:FAD-dependent oxidoreductase [Secundilactobacillus paracollinoides]ANZ60567.1 pyridine nucleotide-disulfide oxidoreductase [Secundilactobacillus paracollinoides]ANZ64922.1 pyridine nucleotide-disulfide oxidoreductase [Secundilactobacillus paracollinoides]ANZ66440.1 pyridine nucleotide-disulfide oxidoreductase [Secundilactobacillus paracollinoides]